MFGKSTRSLTSRKGSSKKSTIFLFCQTWLTKEIICCGTTLGCWLGGSARLLKHCLYARSIGTSMITCVLWAGVVFWLSYFKMHLWYILIFQRKIHLYIFICYMRIKSFHDKSSCHLGCVKKLVLKIRLLWEMHYHFTFTTKISFFSRNCMNAYRLLRCNPSVPI
jgi:hypothetical protein